MTRFFVLGLLLSIAAFAVFGGRQLTIFTCVMLAVPLALIGPPISNRAGHYNKLLRKHLNLDPVKVPNEYGKIVAAAQSSRDSTTVRMLSKYRIYQNLLAVLAGHFAVWCLVALFVTLRGA